MKYFLVVVLMVLSGYTGFAQLDFNKAYVITNDGDSLNGEILSTGYIKHAKACTFRKNAEHKSVQYLPGDIRGYMLKNGQYYISKTHTINKEEKLMFLEYLVDGQIDLFYFLDDQKKDHFIIQTESGEMIELDNSEKKVTVEGKDYYSKISPFVGQLNYIYNDAPDIEKEVIQTSYNKKSMIKTAVSYHNEVCPSEECIVYKRESVEVNIQIGPAFALNQTPPVHKYGLRSDALTNAWGGFIGISTPEYFNRFAFRYTVLFHSENYYEDELEFTREGIFAPAHYTVYSTGTSKYIENLFQLEFTLFKYGPLKFIIHSGGYFNVGMQGILTRYTSIYDEYLDETREDIQETEIERNGGGIVYGAKINIDLFRKSSLFVGVEGFTHETIKVGGNEFSGNRIKLSVGVSILNL